MFSKSDMSRKLTAINLTDLSLEQNRREVFGCKSGAFMQISEYALNKTQESFVMGHGWSCCNINCGLLNINKELALSKSIFSANNLWDFFRT